MAEWTKLGELAEMPAEGQLREVTAGGATLCVARIGGALHALDNVCPHRGAPLAEGVVEDGRVICPWHGWSFDPVTGAEWLNPRECVRIYPVRVNGTVVECEV